MKRYALRAGEPLAIDSTAIRRDEAGFFLMLGDAPAPENETRGEVTIVKIRGALVQFKGEGGDSYEAILERAAEAFAADPKPTNVALDISSPGGVVAGLNECVFKLQRMSEEAKIPLTGLINEMAASAAFALCCACSELVAPPSAVVGSVGVISTMISVAARDKSEGVDVRLITSGRRKADGHLHAAITDDAEEAERERNNELARQFFALAADARGMSAAKLGSLEAGIFLGKDALRVGLIDEVMSIDRALYGLGATTVEVSPVHAPNAGNVTRRSDDLDAPSQRIASKALDALRYGVSPLDNHPGALPMAVKLSALIRSTTEAIASETDPKKILALQSKLAAFSVVKAEMDDDDDDEPEPQKKPTDDDDESKAEKAKAAADKAKRAAEAAKHRAKAAEHKSKAAESEEAAKRCEEEDGDAKKEEAAASPAVLAALAEAPNGGGALGVAMAEMAREVAELRASKDADTRAALLAKAKAYTPPHMLAAIKGLGLADLQAFVAVATKGEPMVYTTEGELVKPKAHAADSEASLPPSVVEMIDGACAAISVTNRKAFRAQLVADQIRLHNEQLAKANGGSARY